MGPKARARAALKNARVEGERGSADSSMDESGERSPRLAEGVKNSMGDSGFPHTWSSVLRLICTDLEDVFLQS